MTTVSSVLGLCFLILTGSAFASEEVAKQEGLVCTVCHDKPGSKLLTDRGKYFEVMRGMDGFDDIEASFQSCTYCHRRRPGSLKLTKTGDQFLTLAGDMAGLLEWMRGRHPAAPQAAEDGEGDRDQDRDEESDLKSEDEKSDNDSSGLEDAGQDGEVRPIPSL